ncbi:Glycoside hydrolase superfamily [Phytophthora cactorum]|nr:Glycoside hydrolase superfamily [Phytophthora cactorum]
MVRNEEVENWDQLRYYKAFLGQVYKAVVEEEIPVVGYTAWSFLDNYEWGSYGPRFGLYYVNFTEKTGSPDFEKPKSTDLKRIPRPAAKWFHKVATTKCLDGWDQLEIAADSSVARSAEHLGFSVAFIVFVAVALTAAVVTFKRRLGYQRLRKLHLVNWISGMADVGFEYLWVTHPPQESNYGFFTDCHFNTGCLPKFI